MIGEVRHDGGVGHIGGCPVGVNDPGRPAPAAVCLTRLGLAAELREREGWEFQVDVEPDAVPEAYCVDEDGLLISHSGRERIAFDSQHSEPASLVEAQVAGIGRAGGHENSIAPSPARLGKGRLDERAPDAAPLDRFVDSQDVDLQLAGIGGGGQLEETDRTAFHDGDQDIAGIDVTVEPLA